MKLKQRPGDFRVRELLTDGVVGPSGEHRIYRVTKSKLTSREAAKILADEAGAKAGDVAMAGLKDRQGVTVQFMSLPRGREVRLRDQELLIESVGFADEPLASSHSLGNAFELTVRALERSDLATLRTNLPFLREFGVPNFFDEQRFGNLRHGQGWIARRLMLGETSEALRDLLAASSQFDDERARIFKRNLREQWGDWRACRSLAGKFGEHHSVFDHLLAKPDDTGGAFYRVASRLRLIHLYAWQSHIWNRAVTAAVRRSVPVEQRHVVESPEGPLVCPGAVPGPELADMRSFRLPGPRFEDVTDPLQRELLTEALAQADLSPDEWDIQGVPGFQLKGEDRELFIVPRHLRVRPAEPDRLNRGQGSVKLRFELPRGSYATLVVKRLLAPSGAEVERGGRREERRDDRDERGDREERGARGPGGRGREPRGGGDPWAAASAGRRGRGGPSDHGSRGSREQSSDPWGDARRSTEKRPGRDVDEDPWGNRRKPARAPDE